jgi:iron(III) transport system permease protein
MKSSLLLRVAVALAILFVLAFVAAPLALMLRETVHGDEGFSLGAWREILASEVDRAQWVHSLLLGALATAIATLIGGAHAFLTYRTDLPGARFLGPLGALPLAIPPILLAMAFADRMDARGLPICALILGIANAPFVAVLAGRGLRSIDGRAYEAALLARGRGAAERSLLRSIAPEIAAGALFAFIFIVSEHGVPEFLTVKGKAWHTYAEGVFSRWTRRAAGADPAAIGSPAVAAVPLVALIGIAMYVALRLRGRATVEGDHRPLPVRRLGGLRHVALLVPLAYLGAAVVLPLVVMFAWSAGSTRADVPPSLDRALDSFRLAIAEAGGDLGYTLAMAAVAALLALAVALPLARAASRGARLVDVLAVVPVAVPAVLLGIGLVKVFNRDEFFTFYDQPALLAAGYAARFLPFAVLTLSSQWRRLPAAIDEAARIVEPSALRRATRVHLPLLFPAIWSAMCLLFLLCARELDLAVVLPAGNGTVVRRLSNIVHFGGEEMGGALALLLLLAALLLPIFTVLLTGKTPKPLS